MNVLIACEYSGKVRQAFRSIGHNAWSCDLLHADDDNRHHYKGDCMRAISEYGPWDLIIMHPPCTALCVSGNAHYAKGMPKYQSRLDSLAWTLDLWKLAIAHSPRVAMENPVGVLSTLGGLPCTQYIQPWQFGHGETKKTGLWLSNLPDLIPTNIVEGREPRIWKMGPSADRWKQRSETFQGIANAMAAQWGSD